MTAWAITVKDWPEIDAVVSAETRGKAHAAAYKAAQDAGYNVAWGSIRVRREYCYGPWEGCLFSGRPIGREYLDRVVFGLSTPAQRTEP